MTAAGALWVFLGGGIGSVLRYSLSGWMARTATAFPWPILTANVIGSLIIGIIAALIKDRSSVQWLLLVTGVLGGFTTFSTFSLDTLTLLQAGRVSAAAAYSLGSLALGLIAALVGFKLTLHLIHG
ncbi:MAG: fluoride efflux transporter CrcB [Verrucomicrobiaceae bacterium]|nr:fluoride efflux transporter CrcB [Verrucomicrobiaceae bacterium]